MRNVFSTLVFVVLISVYFTSCETYSAVRSLTSPDKDYLRVVTKDNQIYEGKAPLPKITTKKIKLKASDNKIIEIESTNIAYLQAWHEGQNPDNAWKMVYTPIKEFKSVKEDGNMEYKTRDKERWLVEAQKEKNISLYFEFQEYNLKKDGSISGKSASSGSMPPNAWYYVQRPGEDIPTKIALSGQSVMNANTFFKSWGQKYFIDCPKMVEQIKNKQLKSNKISDIINFYTSECQ